MIVPIISDAVARAAFDAGRKAEREEILDYVEWVMTMYSPFGEGPLALRHVICDVNDGKHLVRAERLRKAAAKKAKPTARKRKPKRAGRGKRK